jgi:hypothetical protein
MKVRYRPFTATWQTYLGCSIILESSQGRTFSFIGSRYLEPSVCGAETEFIAASGQMVVGFTLSGTNLISGIQTSPAPNYCTACLVGQYKSALGTQACSSCPSHSTSPQASQTVGACVCNAAYSGPAGGPCTIWSLSLSLSLSVCMHACMHTYVRRAHVCVNLRMCMRM